MNEADRIGRCIHSLTAVYAETIVLDSGSTDDTVGIARRAGARVEQQPWPGFAAQKNAVIALARQPWVLLLDADEWLGESAAPKLRALFSSADIERADVWEMTRRTRYLGRPLNFGGWGREAVQRLFRSDLRYQPALVHEMLDVSGRRVARLDARIEHETARSAQEFRAKMTHYAMLWAEQKYTAGRRPGAFAGARHATKYWLKHYLLRGGFLDGRTGFAYHCHHARYVYEKYAFLTRKVSAPRNLGEARSG